MAVFRTTSLPVVRVIGNGLISSRLRRLLQIRASQYSRCCQGEILRFWYLLLRWSRNGVAPSIIMPSTISLLQRTTSNALELMEKASARASSRFEGRPNQRCRRLPGLAGMMPNEKLRRLARLTYSLMSSSSTTTTTCSAFCRLRSGSVRKRSLLNSWSKIPRSAAKARISGIRASWEAG